MTLKKRVRSFIKVKRDKEKDFLSRRGVIGVSVGKKIRGGQDTGELAIVVYVREKLPKTALKPEDLIPDVVYDNNFHRNQYITDVVEQPRFEALGIKKANSSRTGKWRPAPGGVSIGHCLFPFTRITTKNGLKLIKDIEEGDYVLTHENIFKKVIKKIKRRFVGKSYSLSYAYPGGKGWSKITATAGHPILSVENGKILWKPIEKIKEDDYIFIQANQCKICGIDIPWFYGYCDKHHHTQQQVKPRIANSRYTYSEQGSKHYYEDIFPTVKELEKEGFRVVPIGRIVPDLIAIKDNKIFAVEVEDLTAAHNLVPNYGKYPNEISPFIDDVIWIVKKREPKSNHKAEYLSGLLSGFVGMKITKKTEKNIPDVRTRKRKSNAYVYDLEVDGSHSFVASRTVVHNSNITAGTLGTWLKDKDGKWVLLSNNHILANSNDAMIGDHVLQPGPVDGGILSDSVAKLKRFVPITFIEDSGCSLSKKTARSFSFLGKLLGSGVSFQTQRLGVTNQVDCAIAEAFEAKDVKDSILGIATKWEQIGEVDLDDPVLKSGRTTETTYGKITGIDATLTIGYGDNRTAIFDRQTLSDVESAGGDSGSCVFKDDGKILIGLLFAGGDGVTVLNPITLVFDKLGLK